MAQCSRIYFKNKDTLLFDSFNVSTLMGRQRENKQQKQKPGKIQPHRHTSYHQTDVASSFNSYSILHRPLSLLSTTVRRTQNYNWHWDQQQRYFTTTEHDNHNNNPTTRLTRTKSTRLQGISLTSSRSLPPFSNAPSDSSSTSATVVAAELSHVDSTGKANMVDVSEKKITTREAIAEATVNLSSDTFQAVANNKMKKGDVLTVAQIAGIMGAKHTSNLIPLCHPLPLHKVDVNLELREKGQCVVITALAKTTAMTGVEMEALTAATIAALTIYDMCKAMGHSIIITNVRLIKKSGGKSDYYVPSGTEDLMKSK